MNKEQENVTMTLKNEIELLKYITSKHIAVDVENIDVRKKTGEQVMARMVICNILMENGIKPAQLAKHFCKHRTNYYHYLKLHKEYIKNPRMHPEYIDMFEAVYNEYKDKSTHLDEISKLQAIEDIDGALQDLIQIRKLLIDEKRQENSNTGISITNDDKIPVIEG